MTALVWFRRDLRLHDNPALTRALADGHTIIPVYIHAPTEEGEWSPGAACRWWLHHSLTALDKSLQAQQSYLRVYLADSTLQTLQKLLHQSGATAVYWNRLYEPALIERDTHIKQTLQKDGFALHSFDAALLNAPWAIKTRQDEPYRVFTPYWKACHLAGTPPRPLPEPTQIPAPAQRLSGSVAIDDLRLLPRIRRDSGLAESWLPGEAGARQRLEMLCNGPLGDYKQQRDFPGQKGTARLSPHLHFGELSARQVYYRTAQAVTEHTLDSHSVDSFQRQLYWRDFAHNLLYHYPQTPTQPLYEKFNAMPWQDKPAVLMAWQQGRTGYPIVDAGMHELWATGWMHNRVRMITASLLTKNCQIHWLHGARWFWDTLVDANLANNTLGWQWVAGSGADAAPYYRIFNPVLQSEKFDATAAYLRRWLPALAALSDRDIHNPDAAQRHQTGYPAPIVDYRTSRQQALMAYEAVRHYKKSG